MTIIKKRKTSVHEVVKKLGPLFKMCSHFGSSSKSYTQSYHMTPHHPLLGIYPREKKASCPHKYLSTPRFLTVLLIIARVETTRCSPTDACINSMGICIQWNIIQT